MKYNFTIGQMFKRITKKPWKRAELSWSGRCQHAYRFGIG